MKQIIWLDDLRDPANRFSPEQTITWVQDYNDFVWVIDNIISKHGPICLENNVIIHLDHDLGRSKNGLDCVNYLIDKCLDYGIDFPEYYIHSQNPVGHDNMERKIINYKKHYDKNSLQKRG